MKQNILIFIAVVMLSGFCHAAAKPTISRFSYKETGKDYLITVTAPAVYNCKNRAVEMKISNSIDQTLNNFHDRFLKRKNKPFNNFTNTMSVWYDIVGLTNNYLSIKFHAQSFFAGAAHPEHWLDTVNINIKTGERLALADFFHPNTDYLFLISYYCAGDLLARKNIHLDPNDVRNGTSSCPENYKYFNLSNRSLIITFPEYQVAPYYEGEQTVEMKFENVYSMINPNK